MKTNERTIPIMGKCEMFTTPENLITYTDNMLKAFDSNDIVPVNVLVNRLTDYYTCVIEQLRGNNPNTDKYKTFDLQDFFESTIAKVNPQMQIYAYTLAYGMTNYYYDVVKELESV